MAVITISEEFGTESEKVAIQTAQRLGYEYIGKRNRFYYVSVNF